MPTALDVRPQKSASIEDGDFLTFPDVPVFKSHTTRDGHDIDERALQRICQRCNDRIRDTGDFAPVVLRHTRDDGDFDPEVVGFAGPYRMGTIGELDPKPAILTHLRIFKEDADKIRKYPRLSVEYWASEDDPTNGYFDPISLLGAETPELDLGIRYSKDAGGLRVLRYAKVLRFQAAPAPAPAFPGGSNTYVPSGGHVLNETEKRLQYERGAGMLSPEDIQQIVTAMQPVIAEAVAQAMPSASASHEEPDEDEEGGPSDMDEDNLGEDLEGLENPEPGEEDEGEPDAEGGETKEEGGEDEGSPADMAEDLAEKKKTYQQEPSQAIEPDKRKPMLGATAGRGDETPDHYAKLCKYAAMDDDEGGCKYAKDMDDDSRSAVAVRMEDEPDEDVKMRLKKYMAMPDETAESVSGGATVSQYQKERDQYRVRYQKERRAHEDLKTKYEKLRVSHNAMAAEKRKAVRYQKLAELTQEGYLLEPDEEVDDCENMNDVDFTKHCERIRTKYQRVPFGSIPIPKSPFRDGVSKDEKRERYAKQAAENVLKARAKGEQVDYKAELDRLVAEDTVAG